MKEKENLEEFLLSKKFELFTYSGTNKYYRLDITEYELLYVRIYSDTNVIIEVEYEMIAMDKYCKSGIVSFEKINNLKRLKQLIRSLT